MITANIQQARDHLSAYLSAVERGETVLLCRRNVPIAEIRPLSPECDLNSRPLGLASDRGEEIPETFFDPLPAELQAAFSGE